MPLQDLTPQLRTRLNQMERAVGWFVFVATVLLLSGFGYYLYHTAEQKGWFRIKAPFFTYVQSSAGLKVGDPVLMMGFPVGHITLIKPMPPRDLHNVRVEFDVQDQHDSFRYIWSGGSYLKVNSAGFLNQRQLEVTRGTNGYSIVVTQPVSIHSLDEAKSLAAGAPGHWQLSQDIFDTESNIIFHAYDRLEYIFNETNSALLAKAYLESNSVYIYDNSVNRNYIVASWDARRHHYKIFEPGDDSAWLRAVEAPPVSDQLQAMTAQVQAALPNILALTNKLAAVLDNAALATSNLNVTIASTGPLITNFAAISGELRGPGALGVWVLGTNAPFQLETALTNANVLLVNTDTNLDALTDEIGMTLNNLADITSNLNAQVQANSNLLGGISKTIMDSDTFIQGLKHHWLLRSAFKSKATNQPAMKK
jgi:ABC-type transporter Mla subunit MlaD